MSWKKIDHFDYSVSAFGNVRNDKTGKILKPNLDKRLGYLSVVLSSNGKRSKFSIHRLVAIIFIPKIYLYKNQVNHIDGNKQNNKINNLEWCTNRENMIHAVKTGLWKPYKRETQNG